MADQENATSQKEETQPLGVDITPNKDGGVFKEIKRAGSDEEGSPQTGDTVSVHYVGTLTDGSKFDSSRDRGELFEFQLGKGQVIKAWDLGVASMKKGELAVLTCNSEYAYGKAGSPPKIPPGATLVFEVELFFWKGEDLTEEKDGGILRSQITKGEGHSSPNNEASCEIHIIGKYKGRVFEDRDAKFVLGEGSEAGLVNGVETALEKFKKGETSKLLVTSAYAYGLQGNKEFDIPAGADLEYEVTLKTFEKAKEAWEMDTEEKIEQCDLMKQKGTSFFKQGKYPLAIRYYKKIVEYLENETTDDKTKEQVRTLQLAAQLNIAMCQLKVNESLEARNACDKAIELDPNSEKGYFRRGTANQNLSNLEDAVADFQKALEIDPNNKAAKNQLALTNAKIQKQKQREKKLYAGMFDKFAKIDKKKEEEESVNEPSDKAPEENGTSEPTDTPTEQADAEVEVSS